MPRSPRCAQDGDGSGAGSTRDSVVNQLLALMDGVADLLTPTFVIALTNRRELVDSAVLRPGRLEVQVLAFPGPDSFPVLLVQVRFRFRSSSGPFGLFLMSLPP